MWFLAELQFNEIGFQTQGMSLIEGIDSGEILTIRLKVEELIHQEKIISLLYRYGFGQVPFQLPSVEDVNYSPYRNSIIGNWLSIIMAQYLEPSQFNIGFNWRMISEILIRMGWSADDINLLINGLPIGVLFGKPTSVKNVIEHTDPYWYWIRPKYSYNQGGYIPRQECEKIKTLLATTQSRIMEQKNLLHYFPMAQEENWLRSLKKGFDDAIHLIDDAITNNRSIYSAIYWEWDDD